MNKKDYYVTLTGSKNNAGDFLIKYRAFKLFKELRPDRDIVDYNEWEYLDDEKLQVVNNSKALILLGGPSVVFDTYPGAYKLRDTLDDIKVPILMMGVGWKDPQGEWKHTYTYELSSKTIELLKKISKSDYLSSARDYHTLNMLQSHGFKNFSMTGCPAYYDMDFIGQKRAEKPIKKIAFSLGVSFIESPSMDSQMKSLILKLKEKYKNEIFEVVFHHSLDSSKIEEIYGSSHSNHLKKHLEFAKWLKSNEINFIDISGSAENLINYYSTVDLHIGYRVHAHIFMNSIRKFSILLCEDGRGKAVEKTIGGIVLDAYLDYKHTFCSRVLNRLFESYSKFKENPYLDDELFNNIEYEEKTSFLRLNKSANSIDSNFEIMKFYLKQLP